MSNKYIIKNCDCILSSGRCNVKSLIFCQDCTDCIMKQIVELCKDAQSECSCQNPIKDIDCFECTSGGRAELGTEILKLLDIQEVK